VRRAFATVVSIGVLAIAGCGGGSDDSGPADAFRSYIDALNKHDGATVCQALEPTSIDKLRPPVKRETCAEGVTDSIGHARRNGSRWLSSEIKKGSRVRLDKDAATLTVDMEDKFTTETQLRWGQKVRMQKSGDDWLLREPDATLYYAIGQK
jgi:hypothetical protein